MASPEIIVKRRRLSSRLEKLYVIISCVLMGAIMMAVPAFAAEAEVNTEAMTQLFSVLKSVSFYVGLGLLAFGVYEIVMSFIQSQPEAKTKGITLGIVGAVMMGLGPVLDGLGAMTP